MTYTMNYNNYELRKSATTHATFKEREQLYTSAENDIREFIRQKLSELAMFSSNDRRLQNVKLVFAMKR